MLFVSLTVLNIGNFGFHVLESRILGPAHYGALGSLLGILVVLNVPMSVLEVSCTRAVASATPGEAIDTIRRALARVLSLTMLLVIGAFVTAPLLASFLHLRALDIMLMAVVVVPSVIGVLPRSLLLGQLRFHEVAAGTATAVLVKLAAAVILAWWGAGVTGAVLAVGVGEIAGAAVYLSFLRGQLGGGGNPLRLGLREVSGPAVAFSGFWALTMIDTLLARHYLPRAQSGYYSAAATAARAVLFLPGAIAIVAFPRFSEVGGDAPERRRVLVHALAIAGTLSVAAAIAVAAFPGQVIGVAFGRAYGSSSTVIGVLGFGSGALCLVTLFVYYLLACRSRWAFAPWVAVAAACTVVAVNHQGILAVATAMLLVDVTLLVVVGTAAAAVGRTLEPVVQIDDHLWRSGAAELDVTIVVPYFCPTEQFLQSVARLMDVLERAGATFEVIAVSDGTTDSEATAVDPLDARVRVQVTGQKSGKGDALRLGLASGRGRYVGFIDADGDLDPDLLKPFLAMIELYHPDIVLGSKRHPLSDVDYPFLRRSYSVAYQCLIALLFRLNIRDTQTGLKLVRREVLAAALPRMVEKRFAFDLELFVVARRLGYQRFLEAPVKIGPRFSSSISMNAVWGMLKDTLAVFYRCRILRFYDRPIRWTSESAGPPRSAALPEPVAIP